jgi:hypothetical protein
MVAAGALTGWLACTRVAMLAPLALYLVTYFRRDEARAATIAAVSAAAVASAVLAPFVLWSPRLFAANNPFVHQTALTPLPLVAAAAIACVALGRLTRDFSRQCLAAGLVLCGGTAVAFALRASSVGWRTALIGSGFDISYFDLSAPFLVVPLLFVRPVGGSHLAPAVPPAAGGTR